MPNPEIIGGSTSSKRKKDFSFEYAKTWLTSKHPQILDPDIQFYSSTQYIHNKENFGIFLDSKPDTWGRSDCFCMLKIRRLFARSTFVGSSPSPANHAIKIQI